MDARALWAEREVILFSNELVWVTGSSTGIGRAITLGFAREGCRVVVHYNSSKDKAQEVA